jgi:hypothetical protein
MAELALTNIINVSVADAPAGAGEYNTSNLACFTEEAYNPATFGSDGYKIYLTPDEVATDFGSSSKTYAMALQVFSQRPNILAGGGYFVVIPFIVEVQTITPSAVPTSGTYEINFNGDVTPAINWNDTASQIQTKVRTLNGLEQAVVTGTLATAITITFKGYYGDAPMLTITNNTLDNGITLTVAQATAGETFAQAITRASALVQFFGVMATQIFAEAPMLAAAAVVQSKIKMAFFVSRTAADVDPGGLLDKLATGNWDQSRGLLYASATTDLAALLFMASYASRALSVDFSGSNTTITMHMKDLVGVQPDTGITQNILEKCESAGVDFYGNFQGVPKVYSTGGNTFFDRVYNRLAFAGALQIAGFNFLARSSTKVPQTESGMDAFKSAYRAVCEQYVTNGFLAPGRWTSPTTFGNQEDFYSNIEQRGYYMFSKPIAQQSTAARENRQAPLLQIAAKEAGAFQKGNVLVNLNA